MIKTLADTVIWLAKQRLENEPFQNINAAIVSVTNDMDLALANFMKDHIKRGK